MWQFAPNSLHYLLSLWQRMVASMPYVKNTEPHLLESYAPEVTPLCNTVFNEFTQWSKRLLFTSPVIPCNIVLWTFPLCLLLGHQSLYNITTGFCRSCYKVSWGIFYFVQFMQGRLGGLVLIGHIVLLENNSLFKTSQRILNLLFLVSLQR